MNLNLILAVVWFLVGVFCLVTTWVKGDASQVVHLGNVTISLTWVGWMAAVLCLYNLVRWWFRPRRGSRDPVRATLDAHRRPHRSADRPEQPPDPNFNFTDPPSASEPRRPDPPPSAN